jgi:signal transduction histidine kinase
MASDEGVGGAEVLGAAHAALSARYQQLVLLNRLSAELFSGKPLGEALKAAGPVLLALTGAKGAAIHFVKSNGKLYCALLHADKKLKEAASIDRLERLVRETLSQRGHRISAGVPGWAASPLEEAAGAEATTDGVISLAFREEVPTDPGRAKLLAEIGAVVRRARRLERDLERRQQLEKMKSEMLSLTSHELRTPLSAIMGFAELLIEEGDSLPSDKRREQLEIILSESKRLARLVNEYLDLSKMEAGGVQLERKRIYLAAIFGRLAALFHGHESKAVLKSDLAADAAEVWADDEQLYRALVNLCGNALRYSNAGGAVTVSARRVQSGVELAVADQGPGLSHEARQRLFQPFSRGDDAVALRTRGTGLGLAITKAIVEAHGGKIAVDEAYTGGARFTLTLPDRAAPRS